MRIRVPGEVLRSAAVAFLGFLLLAGGANLPAVAGASSQDAPASPDTLRISLEGCIDRALAVGEEMQRVEAERSTAHARYLQARSTALPQLTLTTSYTRQVESIFGQTGSGVEPFEPDTLASTEQRIRDLERALPTVGFFGISQILSSSAFASRNSWDAALGLRQKLFQGGSVWSSVAAARHAMKTADLYREDKRSDVVLQVRQAYLNALLADRGVVISRLGLELAEMNLERVRLRQEAGQTSEFERLQSEVERDNQVPAVRRSLSLQLLAYLDLRRLCNIPKDDPLALTTALLDSSAVPAEPAAVDTAGLVEAALGASGITALEQALEARSHAITVAAAGYYPDVSVFGNLSQQAFPQDGFPKRGQWRRDINVGMSATWSLFDGFLTRGAVEEAKANRSKAREDLAQARELVRQAVVQGRSELERSAAELHARSRTVELARRALDLAGLRYEEGASSLLEVTDARIAWQVAQSNEAQARRDYFAALAQLERYTNRPLFSSLAPPPSGR